MGMTPEQARAWQLVQEGMTQAEAACQLSQEEGTTVTKNTVNKRIMRARKWAEASDGQASALEATGLQPDIAKFGWRIVQHEDGSRDSVFWDSRGAATEDMIEAIQETFSSLPTVKPVKAPKDADSDLITLYPIADLHAGMMAWGRETGEDFDTKTATDRLVNWAGKCIDRSPRSGIGVVLGAGDMLHNNDATNQTKSGHVLDVDTRLFKTVDSLIAAMAITVDMALNHHDRVEVVVKPGNHDRDAYLAILFALDQRYRNEPRVTVDKTPSEFWAYQFGKVMLACHHGDKAKAERMVLFLADQYPEMWGATRHRFLFTGHLHHSRVQDIGGVKHEQLRAMTAKDAYAASHAYSARAEMQAITYHRDCGEVSRVKVAA